MANAIQFIISLAVLVFSVVIHEVSHGLMASVLGDQTAKHSGRLTLNPLPHISLFGTVILPLMTYFAWGVPVGAAKPVPYNPYNLKNQKWGPAMVAAAGPASNLVMALFFGLILRLIVWLSPASYLAPAINLSNLISIFGGIAFINIALAVFNLLPIPPLDGSKVLEPFLPLKVQYRLSIMWRETVMPFFSRNWIIILILFFFFGSYILFAVSGLIFPVISLLFRLITGFYL